MEFNELIADFSRRHNVENLVVVDGAASLDIDDIIVTIVANEVLQVHLSKLLRTLARAITCG